MTIHRNGTNGTAERIEPGREEDIVTVDMIAAKIAKAVCKEIRSGKDEIAAAALPAIRDAANLMLPLLGRGAEEEATRAVKLWQESALNDIRHEAATLSDASRVLKAWCDETRGTVQSGFLQWRQNHDLLAAKFIELIGSLVGQLKAGSVEVLSAIIGEEISRYDLQTLIRQEVREAVREAIRGLNPPKVAP